MKQISIIRALFLLQFFDSSCKMLIRATSEFESEAALNLKDSYQYENMANVDTMDVELRFQIKPTAVFDMPFSDFLSSEKSHEGVNYDEIKPTAAFNEMPMSAFYHVIEKRQAAEATIEGSGSVDCPALTDPENGLIEGNYCVSISCKATFSCNTGYNLVGQSELTCEDTDQWSSSAPTCAIVDCGVPSVNSATYTGNTQYGQTVSFTCANNYNLIGDASAECQDNGQWTTLPTCIYDCGTPPNVENGEIKYDCKTVTCKANVTCATNYVLEGANLTCERDRGWIFAPVCRENDRKQTGLDIAITVAAPAARLRNRFEIDIIAAILQYYIQQTGLSGIRVVVLSFRYFSRPTGRGKRQTEGDFGLVEVNYTIVSDNEDIPKGEISEAHSELLLQDQLTVDGEQLDILETTILGNTYAKDAASSEEGRETVACDIYENLINGCPAGTECHVNFQNDITECQQLKNDDEFALAVGIGVGVPLFMLACAAVACCVYYMCLSKRRRQRHKRQLRQEYESSDSATMSGFSPAAVPTRLNTVGRRGPVYGSYFPEVWTHSESPESDNYYDNSPRQDRRSSLPYVVPIAYEDRDPYKSNFSWDFMYPHVDRDFSMPRPRV